ncbi:MAG: hypothetical protein HY305_04285 [Sphingobacteriales bacterium]|nr:hypothetical protein [Sphingobacteriales bacterium]
MKRTTNKISKLLAIVLICISTQIVFGQSTINDLLNENTEITWLGLDFSQTKFIGSATQFKDAGEVTNDQFRDKYAIGWNRLFINEQKKYDIAKALSRKGNVQYAIDVTEKANNSLKKDFFTNNPGDFKTIDDKKIEGLVKKYDFQGKEGIGMIVFVEGMSKDQKAAGGWITFIDMKSKKILATAYKTAEPGGFGFKNFWAKAFLGLVKEADDYKKWK